MTATLPTRLAPVTALLAFAAALSAQDATPATPAANPDEAPPEGDVLRLNDLVVTGSITPRSKLESPVAITTVDRTQIDDKQPRSFVDGLKLVPGFYVESSGGETNENIFVRGLIAGGGFAQVALQEDGLPVISESDVSFSSADAYSRFDIFTANMEAIRGGTGAIFQGNAPGGVINIISREGSDRSAGEAMLQVGDYGLVRGDLWVGGPVGKNTTYALGGFYRVSDGIRDPGYVADKGGQLRFNVKHTFADGRGYIKFLGKVLDDRNLFTVPIPLLYNGGSPKSIPGGPDIRESTNASADMARVHLGNTPAGTLDFDLRDGVHITTSYAGTELAFKVTDGLRIENRNRYTDVKRPFIAIFPSTIATPLQSFANQFATSANAGGQFAAALLPDGNYNYQLTYPGQNGAVAAANPAAAAALNGNGLGMNQGFWYSETNFRNFQNDFRLIQSLHDGATQLSAGIYYAYLHEDEFWHWQNMLTDVSRNQRRLDLVYLDALTNQPIGPATSNGLTQVGTLSRRADYEEKQVGLYAAAQHTWRAWNFNAGIRRESLSADGNMEQNQPYNFVNGAWVPATGATPPPGTNPALANASFGNGNFLAARMPKRWDTAYNAAVNYTLNPKLAIFADYSRTYRLPRPENVITGTAGTTFDPSAYPTEHIDQYELGLKYAGRSVALFLTGFFAKDKDVFAQRIFTDPQGNIQTANDVTAGEAKGVEVEALWTPWRGLSLNPVFSVQQMEYTSDNFATATVNGSTVIVNYKGKQPIRIPEVHGTLNATYAFPRTGAGTFRITGSWRYVGDRFADTANTAKLKAFNEFDFGASFTMTSGLIFRVQVANAFNSDGITEGDPRTASVIQDTTKQYFNARPILPRSIIGSVTYRF